MKLLDLGFSYRYVFLCMFFSSLGPVCLSQGYFLSFCVFECQHFLVVASLVVSTSAIDCLKGRLQNDRLYIE